MPDYSSLGGGFESGYQSAMDIIQARKAQAQQMEMNQLKMQRLAQEQEIEEQTRQLTARAFESTSSMRFDTQVGGQNAAIISGLQNAGVSLMRVDPSEGRKFLEEARSLQYQNSLDRRALQEQQQKQQADIGAFAAAITDQTSLEAALPELAQAGFVVPPQFRTFNPLAGEYFKGVALRSMGAAKAMDYQLRAQEAERKASDRASQEEAREARLAQREAEIQIQREKAEVAEWKAKIGKKEQKFPAIGFDIEASLPEYDQLDSKGKLAMENWVSREANRLLKEDETLSKEDALQQAIEGASGKIKVSKGFLGSSASFDPRMGAISPEPRSSGSSTIVWERGPDGKPRPRGQ